MEKAELSPDIEKRADCLRLVDAILITEHNPVPFRSTATTPGIFSSIPSVA
ncbi:hypothetical protein AtDm6_2991 [Acetobacter tropicalis]|uniref:Uncharacterized protein n=1 Tax=Acetobacter tropicalis TaxID=104102 RepID=A0A094YH53_9PROT|nr:hypothetical protein AtDm6_2991 [Acetobacter tropicalis]